MAQKLYQNYKKALIILSSVTILCIIGWGTYALIPKHHVSPPLPPGIVAGVSFPVYYSSVVVNGYSLQTGSTKVKAGILFFTLANRSKKIFITEQNAPSGQVNLKSLPKYSSLDVPIGQAVIGTGLGNPSIVIMTPATLVELTSNKGVTKVDIISVAQMLTQQ